MRRTHSCNVYPSRWVAASDAFAAYHVNEVVKQLKKDGMISVDPLPGKTPARSFTIVANPVLRIARS